MARHNRRWGSAPCLYSIHLAEEKSGYTFQNDEEPLSKMVNNVAHTKYEVKLPSNFLTVVGHTKHEVR